MMLISKNTFKTLFSRNRKVRSKDWRSDFERCRDTIKQIHRVVILDSDEDRERGLEDAIISDAALDGLCDRMVWEDSYVGKAALAIDYIVTFHPFAEGNKRTAFNVAISLLRKDNLTVRDREETYLFIRDVAMYGIKKIEIEGWLRRNCTSTILEFAHNVGEFTDGL